MLLLVFWLGDDRFALEVSRVVEVVPSVPLRPVPQAPSFVAGLLSYRGQILPVIDLLQLIHGRPARSSLSTRIMTVNCAPAGRRECLIGLRAERVTETLKVNGGKLIPPPLVLPHAAYLGDVIKDSRGMIVCLHVEKLLTESQLDQILAVPAEAC